MIKAGSKVKINKHNTKQGVLNYLKARKCLTLLKKQTTGDVIYSLGNGNTLISFGMPSKIRKSILLHVDELTETGLTNNQIPKKLFKRRGHPLTKMFRD